MPTGVFSTCPPVGIGITLFQAGDHNTHKSLLSILKPQLTWKGRLVVLGNVRVLSLLWNSDDRVGNSVTRDASA